MRSPNLLKKSKYISVLIVPDGDNRTFGFRLNATLCKVVFVFGILCLGAVIIGVVTYWKVAHLALQADRLKKENEFLSQENSKVIHLQKTVYEMKEIDHRLKMLAGVGAGADVQTSSEEGNLEGDTFQHSAQRREPSSLGSRRARTYAYADTVGTSDQPDTLSPTRPNLWPVQGWVTAEFNLTTGPFGRKHTGIDIAAPTDTPVKATADGIITFAGWTEDLGNLVMIQHDPVFSSRYGHNSRILVHQGEHVRKGQTIAFVGSSGKSSASHLHFEIWRDGRPVNPRQYLLR